MQLVEQHAEPADYLSSDGFDTGASCLDHPRYFILHLFLVHRLYLNGEVLLRVSPRLQNQRFLPHEFSFSVSRVQVLLLLSSFRQVLHLLNRELLE